MIKRVFITILLSASYWAQAQSEDTLHVNDARLKYDTLYIADLSDKLAVYLNFSGKIHQIAISSVNSEKDLTLLPNGYATVGIGLDYKWLGLGASFSLNSLNKDDEIYGKTEKIDMQVNCYTRSFGIDGYFKYYKGFYLENPLDFMEWQNVQYPLLQDMETFAAGLSAYYFFNHKKFSFKAAYPRTQMQKKNAGSFISGAYLNYNIALSPGGFLPAELPDSLIDDFDVDAFTNARIGISFGYTYTLLIRKKFFTNLALVPGFAYTKSEISRSLQNPNSFEGISASITFRLAMGYEGKHLYWGFNLVSMADSFQYENMDISATTGNLRFFIGKRFNIKKLFRKN